MSVCRNGCRGRAKVEFPNIPYVNRALIGEPLNWAVVFVMATIALLGFHVVMQGFGAMQGDQPAIGTGGAPGTIASPDTPTPGFFGYVNADVPGPLQTFPQGSNLTDSYDARYAEDNLGINY